MWRKRQTAAASKMAQRLSKIPTADLTGWADSTLFDVGRHLTSWQRVSAPEDLADAERSAQVLLEVIQEMSRRHR